MGNMNRSTIILILIFGFVLGGCGGLESFPYSARSGDTVALAVGWKKAFDREALTITITPSTGSPIVYEPGHAAVRAVINLYPDPLSSLVIGVRTGPDAGFNSGYTYGSMVNYLTGYDPDWWQTSVFIDLPDDLPVGTAMIDLQSTSGEAYQIPVQILAGQGSPQLFRAEMLGMGMSTTQLESLERTRHYTVTFDGGDAYPAAIQVDLTHDPDSSAGGSGKAFVVDPRGELKNISWTSNGTNMRVLLTPAGMNDWEDPFKVNSAWKFYKFYIAGGISNVQVQDVLAYDINGNVLEGVSAYATP